MTVQQPNQVRQSKFNTELMVTIVIALIGSAASYGAYLSLDDPLGAYAVIYGIAFVALTWKYPHMALGIGMALAPFQNDVSSGYGPFRMSMGEISVSIAFIVYLMKWFMKSCEMKLGPYLASILIYLAVCMSSSLANWSDAAMTSMLQMVLYFIVTPLVYANLVRKIELMTVCLYMYVGISIFLSIVGLQAGTFFIFGLHKNGVGSSLAMGITICTELFLVQKSPVRKGMMGAAVCVIIAGLIFSLSRGAWLGAVAGFLVVVGTRGKVKFMFQSLIVLIPMIAIFWNLLPQEKREYATSFDISRANISARYASIDFARETFEANPVFGVGVGLRKEFDATNVFWVTLAETGVQGLVTFAAIHVLCLLMIAKTQRFVSRTDPRFSILVLGGALLFAKVVHGIVDHYWSRGPILVAWACCGMATRIYYNEQERLARMNVKIMKSKRLKARARHGQPLRSPR